MLKWIFSFAAVVCAVLLAGCFAPNNNYLEAQDFAGCLKRDGLPVGEVREIPPDPFRANSAVAIKVGESEIGVYKYDRTSKVQEERLRKRERTGRVYINGIPYPVEVYGSFMFMGLEKNPRKRDILKVIRRFN